MDTERTLYEVHQCSKCLGDTEYYCVSCPCDLCTLCKESHVKDLKTIDHDIVSYRDKINYIPTREICVRHHSHVYIKYCEPCQVIVCYSCSDDQSHEFRSFQHGKEQHKIIDIQAAFKTKRQQHRGTIHTIRGEALFYRPVLLSGIKTDFKTCHTEFSFHHLEMLTKVHTLKHLIDYIQTDFMCNYFDFKHIYLKQKIEMIRHIASHQRYTRLYEQSAIKPLTFLLKKTALPKIPLTLHTSQLSMTESLNKEDVIELLSAIQITQRGNRLVRNECLLKLMPCAELHQSLTVTGIGRCFHICCVTSERIWVSDRENNIILTNTTGVAIHRVEDLCSNGGSHTVNSENELIYINRNYNINKLSNDMKTTTVFIERKYSIWIPMCVYWSPSTGDLLVGMYRDVTKYTDTGKVTRYNQSGQLTQTIQQNNKGRGLYSVPNYITENNNGDVVVSDSRAVVVTGRGGRHRFSYTGHQLKSELEPGGICTDALSHILVCDGRTDTVHMLNKDGQFLSYLLKKSLELGEPWSLSYDVNTHRLWVGSWDNNKVCVYRYIVRQDARTDQSNEME
ncbi:uncharacterized protein LOC128164106 [Crassostrea angulata]|uniref:uncharacterized protein LOC128164106 n=1 Tax=Magallana angulata TaxID=2784310 RepID=UPI0022B205E8|nr:uncharacterized protein LOC128164106 [Crassostrea angulata]